MLKQLFFRSGAYFVGLVSVKLVATFLFVFLARFLQPDLFGKLTYFLTILSLLTLITDWGLVQWFQVHRTSTNEATLISRLVSARFFTLTVSVCIFLLFSLSFHSFSLVESVLFIALLVPEAFLSITDGYYLVRHRSVLIAFKQLSKYIFPILLVVFVQDKLTMQNVILSFLISSICTLVWYVPKKFFQVPSFSVSQIKETLSESSSYATLILTSALYSRGDAIILESKLGNTALGLYSAGYRYLDAMSLLPAAFAQNLFHISAQKESINKQKIITMTAVMGGLGVLFGACLFVFSHFLTTGLLGSAYEGTEIIVKIFAVVTVLLFINSPLSTIVQSSTVVKQFLPWGIMNTVLNIGLNVVLIPLAGGIGAAFVMLFTEATGLLINLYFVKQRLKKE
ncbi:MAG: oligosaccharide flippase family protein [Patescibacteria group bacterium]